MTINKKISINSIFAFLLVLNAGTHFLNNVLGIGNIYYSSYIGWIIIFLSMLTIEQGGITRRGTFVSVLLMIVFTIGACCGEAIISHGFTDIHGGFFAALAYLCLYGFNFKRVRTNIDYIFLCKVVLFIGILAVLYAIIFQKTYMFELIKRNNISLNSWRFVSFFRQRNIFGQYCYIASISALILYVKKKSNFYLIVLVLFGFIILLTDSRAALLSYAVLLGLYIYLNRKNKYLFFALVVITCLLFAYAFDFFGNISQIFYHQAANGMDSGAIRLLMWRDCIEYLLQNNILVFGLGMGSESVFLMPRYGVGSTHNFYIDALFDGGIIYLAVILLSLYKILKIIIKIKDLKIRNIFLASIISFSLYGIFEAGMALFGSNYFSITVGILLIILPQFLQRKEAIYE